jgi:predicted nucleic acid-binding protein
VIVVDASVVVAALIDDEDGGRGAAARLAARPYSPELIGVEVVSALRRLTAAGALEPGRGALAVADFAELPLDLVPHGPLLHRCWELRDNLTPYEGVYVALAELMGAVLVTVDRRLVAAPGIRCQVEVLD